MGYKVIGIDISKAQLEAAEAAGADLVINSMEEPEFEAKIRKVTNGGCHAAAVFSASNIAYESAPKTLRCGLNLKCDHATIKLTRSQD